MQLPDLDSLPTMFERSVQGRTLILDSDFPAYQAAATVKRLETAITRFQTLVETERFVVGAEFVEVHLTPTGCNKCRRFDYPTVKPYQGQRTGPKPALLQPLRSAIQTHTWPDNWSVYGWLDREADDGMIMHGLRHGANGIISSGDKDLCLTSGPYWIIEEGRLDIIENRFGWIAPSETPSGTKKVKGHGTKFFWAQMLMGDSADNVKGIIQYNRSNCGPVAAWDILKNVHDESQAANLVLRAYSVIQQDPLAEAQCLWLRRSDDDCAYKYLCELDLDTDIRAWIDALHAYHQQVLEIKLTARNQDRGQDSTEDSSPIETGRQPAVLDLPWD